MDASVDEGDAAVEEEDASDASDAESDAMDAAVEGSVPGAPGSVAVTAVPIQWNVTTLAGSAASGFADGTGAAAKFGYLSDVAVDANRNVYVADSTSIRKVTQPGW